MIITAGRQGGATLLVTTTDEILGTRADDSGWITLADREGNEFCILCKDPAGSGDTCQVN